MYSPPGTIKSPTIAKEIIALIGTPGSGKTTACLTFPNRHWLDFDHKLPANEDNTPFWDASFCDKQKGGKRTVGVVNTRDAFKYWLMDHVDKFEPEQTLILDSWTMMQNAFDSQTQAEEPLLSKGSGFWFWGQKLNYSRVIMELLRQAKCRVVVTFHESADRDEKGELNGKVAPLQDGKFKDQLLGHFTDVWRQLCDPYERDEKGSIKIVNMKKAVQKGYYWQLLSDEQINTNINPVLGKIVRAKNIRMIPADYNEVIKLYNTTL